MAIYEIVYDIEIDSEHGRDAVFWLERVIRIPETILPDHVHSVRTVPLIREVKPKKAKGEEL